MDNADPHASSALPSNAADGAVATDALLVQAHVAREAASDVVRALRASLAGLPATAHLHAAWSADAGRLYAYVIFHERAFLARAAAVQFEAALRRSVPAVQDRQDRQDLQVSRLELRFETPGASFSQAPAFHYAVEMDPEPGWMPELSEWYDTEHMPGLAKVDGCVRAARYLNHDHGPLSLACYDLVMKEALGSPPWLAVRGTDWSSRMRPRFMNTLRTMFDVLPVDGGV